MASSEFLENYKLVEPTIRKLYDSRLRLAILDALENGPMRLADLRGKVNSNAPNTSSKAKELEEMGLVEKVDGDYKLTAHGSTILEMINNDFDYYVIYEKFKNFWDAHRMDAIPSEFLKRLGELKNSELLACTKTNANAPFEALFKALISLDEFFYGLAPIYHKAWKELPKVLINKDIDTKLILTKSVFNEKVRILSDEGVNDFDKKAIFFEIPEDRSLPAFMVCEKFMFMSLESKNSSDVYLNSMLYSTDKKAIQWALDLFEFYKSKAKPVKLSDYL
jgi:predicted transcriptional regulator